jgi:hypothetical protein
MESKRVVVLITLLIGLLSYQTFAKCNPRWEENVVIQVLDSNGLPLQNAYVQATYQIDYTSGKGYATTKPIKTNTTGMVKIHMKNMEIMRDRVDCYFTIIAYYDNQKITKKFVVGQHPKILTMELNVARVSVNVFDQDGNPITDALVMIRNISSKTDSFGKTVMEIGKGEGVLVVLYGDGQVERNILIKNNQETINVQFPIYTMSLRITNDDGKPIPAVVRIGKHIYHPDNDGYVNVDSITTRNPRVEVEYGSIRKKLSVDLSAKQNYEVIFDFTPPIISDIQTMIENGRVRCLFSVKDPGTTPSGIAPNGIVVKVTKSNGEYEEVSPYTVGPNMYKVDLGDVNVGVWSVEIDATDEMGNKQVIKGYVNIEETYQQLVNITNQEIDQENNRENKKQGLPLLLIIIGFGILLVVVLIIAHYLKEEGFF